MVQPHNTTVSSVIVYQCQQSEFAPSVPNSVCGEDGTWSPDPTQVVCMMMIPTTTVTPTSASPEAPAGVVGECKLVVSYDQKLYHVPYFARSLVHSNLPLWTVVQSWMQI